MAILGDFSSDLINTVALHTGRPVKTINEAVVETKGTISRKLVNKTQKLNTAYAVCRHLTREYCKELITQIKDELGPQTVLPPSDVEEKKWHDGVLASVEGLTQRVHHLEGLMAHAISGLDMVLSREVGLPTLPRQVVSFCLDSGTESDTSSEADGATS